MSLRSVVRLGDLEFGGVLDRRQLAVAGEFSASHAPAEVRLIGVRPPLILCDADIAIAGKVKAAPEDVIFDEATVTTRGSDAPGRLRLADRGRRLAVQASLDAERLALVPLVGPPRPLFAAGRRLERQGLPLALPRDVDLDLRLSVGRLDAYGVASTTSQPRPF